MRVETDEGARRAVCAAADALQALESAKGVVSVPEAALVAARHAIMALDAAFDAADLGDDDELGADMASDAIDAAGRVVAAAEAALRVARANAAWREQP